MNPEVIEEFDAARDALALIDAALRVDDAAAHVLVTNWSSKGEVLLRQLLAITENLTRRVGELTGNDPHEIVNTMRRATHDVEAIVSDPEGDQNND